VSINEVTYAEPDRVVACWDHEMLFLLWSIYPILSLSVKVTGARGLSGMAAYRRIYAPAAWLPIEARISTVSVPIAWVTIQQITKHVCICFTADRQTDGWAIAHSALCRPILLCCLALEISLKIMTSPLWRHRSRDHSTWALSYRLPIGNIPLSPSTMMGYFHDNVVCLPMSLRLTVCQTVTRIDQELKGASFTHHGRWQRNTFLLEMTSWPYFWNYDGKSKIRVRQSMHIYMKNKTAKFHPVEIRLFWRVRPKKKKKKKENQSIINQ